MDPDEIKNLFYMRVAKIAAPLYNIKGTNMLNYYRYEETVIQEACHLTPKHVM